MDTQLQGRVVIGNLPTPIVNLSFRHHWRAEILSARPLILPRRNFVYPAQTEEVERGALEVLVRPEPDMPAFLATCALGFRDDAVPTGLWSCPNPHQICAVSGGYAYLIDTTHPDRFTLLEYRPVLQVHSVTAHGLLVFVGHRSLLAWGADGVVWESEKLSDEGIAITAIGDHLAGTGWKMIGDRETAFTLDLRTGRRTGLST